MSSEAARLRAASDTVRRLICQLYMDDFTLDELEDMACITQAAWERAARAKEDDDGEDWAEDTP